MEMLKNIIQKHKKLALAIGISIVLFILILIFLLTLLIGGSSNKYGNRLEGIDEVKLSGDILDTMALEIEENTSVKSADVRVQGKIINVHITYNSNIEYKKAKEEAEKTLDVFEPNIKEFYNIQYFLTRETSGDNDKGYVIIGNKHPSNENIGWIKGEE